MRVRELIEKLQEMDQEAVVNIYDGYDYHLGINGAYAQAL